MEYNLPILKDETTGRRYYQGLKFPKIPLSERDIYITAVFGDRADLISDQYYSNTGDTWVILSANAMPGDSLFFTPGMQVRIPSPSDLPSIKSSFKELNNI